MMIYLITFVHIVFVCESMCRSSIRQSHHEISRRRGRVIKLVRNKSKLLINIREGEITNVVTVVILPQSMLVYSFISMTSPNKLN